MNKSILIGVAAVFLLSACTPNANKSQVEVTDETKPVSEAMEENHEVDAMEGKPELESQNGEAMMDNGNDEMMEKGTVYEVDAFKYGYSVKEITASPGETITINLSNSDGLHDWVLDEFDAKTKVIKEGEVDSITFTVPDDALGKYEFYCSVGDHRKRGMVGTLTVE